jgi:Ser/Thr protein kinase RdoA (MazF antagonist)
VSDSFQGLTPDRVLRVVEERGLRPTGHCSPLVCLENRVYDVRLEGDAHVVVKFYRPGRWSAEAIREEHAFLADLAAAEIPVCAPLALGGETLLHAAGLWCAVWPRTGGRARDELADDQVALLGRLLARIHNVGAARDAPGRPRLDAGERLLQPLAWLEANACLPASCARRYGQAAREVAAIYEERSRGVPSHRIHGDCHLGNLLCGDAGWFFLDFDDFVVGPAVQDVWMLLPGRDDEAARQRRLLVEGYRQFREFDDRWLDLVEPLRAMRFVWYAAWVARRFDDPAFPDAFPHFGSEAYWQRETEDLEEQLERIATGSRERGGEPGAPSAPPEPELTNKDFFWDL